MEGLFSVLILDTAEKFDCKKDQTLLNGMLALGKKGIPSGCHGGGCGVCRIQVVEGKYNNLKLSRQHVSEADETNGYVLACRMYPESNIKLKIAGKLKKALYKNYLG